MIRRELGSQRAMEARLIHDLRAWLSGRRSNAPASATRGARGFVPADRLNDEWSHAWSGRRALRITVPKLPLLKRGARVFTIGSCFAHEIRAALRASGFHALPHYLDIPFNPDRQRIGKLPTMDNLNYYTTFSTRQEIERAMDGKRWALGDFFRRNSAELADSLGWGSVFQDPYRLNVYADSESSILEISNAISERTAGGLQSADIFVITLGLTEAWRNTANGEFICTAPTPGRDADVLPNVEFVSSTFHQNLVNVSAVVGRLKSNFPGKPIILTVSPVALSRTFTDEDIVVANMASKSILRAVAAEVCRSSDGVHYWPSFEFASRGDIFKKDGRHVRQDAVAEIVGAFITASSAAI